MSGCQEYLERVAETYTGRIMGYHQIADRRRCGRVSWCQQPSRRDSDRRLRFHQSHHMLRPSLKCLLLLSIIGVVEIVRRGAGTRTADMADDLIGDIGPEAHAL